MGKDGMTPKAIANRLKAKGLQKLRWYCQMCEKQCRDENGFKCHCASESHQRQLLLVAEKPHLYVDNFSKQFLSDFMTLLSRRFNTRRVHINVVYQDYISDRHHLHMNSTKWSSLTEFAKYLGKEGLCMVDETPKGWFIQWVDRNPKTLAKQEAILRKEKMEKTEAEREQQMLEEQMERAKQTAKDQPDNVEISELKREDDEKIKLNMSMKSTPSGSMAPKSGFGLKITKTASKPKSLSSMLKESVKLKKTDSSSKSDVSSSSHKKMTAMEEIMHRELERKRRAEEKKDFGEKRQRH